VGIDFDYDVWMGLAVEGPALDFYPWTSSESAYDNSRPPDGGSRLYPLTDSVGGAAAI